MMQVLFVAAVTTVLTDARPAIGPKVLEATMAVPFCAVFEETVFDRGTSTARVSSHKLYRDRAGRTREEISVTSDSGEVESVVFLIDPATLRFVVLDPVTNEPQADRSLGRPPDDSLLIPETASRGRGGTRFPAVGEPRRVVLPDQVIAGFRCQGERATYDDGWTEQWRIDSFDLPLLVRFETGDQKYTSRCMDLRLEDPDPEIFKALTTTE